MARPDTERALEVYQHTSGEQRLGQSKSPELRPANLRFVKPVDAEDYVWEMWEAGFTIER